MKAVMISIQPKWVKKIVEGKKTIEVRKTAPKLEKPFKCFIYMTKNGKIADFGADRNKLSVAMFLRNSGKVIGEFVCDKIEMVNAKCSDYGIDLFYHDCATEGCLTENEVDKYFNIPKDKDLRVMKGNGYALHISNLKIYDKPKELSEFRTVKCTHNYKTCSECKDKPNCIKTIARPFQSWGYVEI